jgi:hypothetical protein
MRGITRQEIITLLQLYVEGKDGDRPEILKQIYASDAGVVFDVRTPNITFPPEIHTSEDIARVLSEDFNRRFKGPRTYYLRDDLGGREDNSVRNMPWLVIMGDASAGCVNVGWGLYDWFFQRASETAPVPWQIARHRICIWEMVAMGDEDSDLLFDLQDGLTYPWATRDEVLGNLGLREQIKEIEKLYGPDGERQKA